MKQPFDKNIRKLVKILNMFPGIKTTGSCGGHKNPDLGQTNEHKFYIQIDICITEFPSETGWKSMGKISQAIWDYIGISGKGKLDIIFCNLSDEIDDPEGICNYFEISGEGIDKEVFTATLINRLNKRG